MEIRSNSALRAARAAIITTVALLGGCGDDATEKDEKVGVDAKDAGGTADEDSKDAGKAEEDAGDGKFRCGDEVCVVSQLAPPCCTEPGAGTAGDPLELTGRGPNLCGADLSAFVDGDAYVCMQTNQPGTLDAACPVTPSPGGDLMGCCTDEGFCGGMEPGIPLGCVYGATGRGAPCGK